MIAMRWMLINQSESGHRVDVCEIDTKETRFLNSILNTMMKDSCKPNGLRL